MDLFKAFDKLVRQVVFGVSEARGDTNTIIDTLVRSGVDVAAASSPCTHHRFQRWSATPAQSPCTHPRHGWPAA